MELLYWHWIVFGIFLVLIELVIPSFTALWFGIGAIFVGIIVLLVNDLSPAIQVVTWAVSSALLTLIWFKILKPKRKNVALPSINEIQGEMGITLVSPTEARPGRVRFSTPIKGFDEWDFKSNDDLEPGDQVIVTGIDSHYLVMKKQ